MSGQSPSDTSPVSLAARTKRALAAADAESAAEQADTATVESDTATVVPETATVEPDSAPAQADAITAVVAERPSTAKQRAVPAARRRSPLTAVLAATTALALAFGVVAGVLWWRADHDPARSAADARDAVVLDARLDIVAVNTSDYRAAGAALTKWLSVSTGTLHGEYEQTKASAVTLLQQAKIVTTATVLDAAVTSLDTSKGTATVIASVDVKKQPASGSAATARNRFRASMTRVGSTWKLSDLAIVSVQLS